MSDIATIEPAHAPAAPQEKKKERISPRIAQAVRLLLSGECKTQKAAAERTGLNATYLCEALAKPKIEAFIARETRKTIARGTMRAGARLIELLDAQSEHVSLDATKHVLAIDGIKPAEQGQAIGATQINVGYIINLTRNDGPGEASAHTAHMREIEAKPLK